MMARLLAESVLVQFAAAERRLSESVSRMLRPDVRRYKDELAQALDDGGVGQAAALAHGLQAEALPVLLQRVQHGGHETRARSTQRVTQGDGAAARVHAVQIHADLLLPGGDDRG